MQNVLAIGVTGVLGSVGIALAGIGVTETDLTRVAWEQLGVAAVSVGLMTWFLIREQAMRSADNERHMREMAVREADWAEERARYRDLQEDARRGMELALQQNAQAVGKLADATGKLAEATGRLR